MARHRLGFWLAAATLLAVAAPPILGQQTRRIQRTTVEAQQRWALVIGNADYASGTLKNPVNDARDVAAVLSELDFVVDLREDATHQEMEDAVRAFGRRLEAGEVGLFYFAGHGVQVAGQNYLIPAGARIGTEAEIPYKAVDLRFVLEHMGEAPGRLNIVILDACRDNPFREPPARSLANLRQGLAQTQAPAGTIIAFATAPGRVAADGKGANGTFTRYLLAALRLEGLTIEEVFKRTRQAVVRATGGAQVPWTSSSLLGDFIPRPLPAGQRDVMVARLEDAARAEPPRRPPVPPRRSSFSLDELRHRARAFEEAQEAWSDYLRDMKDAFEKVELYEEQRAPAHLKAEAWELFLATFDEQNPYSQMDDSLRSKATSRRDLWRREAARVATAPRTAAVRPVPDRPRPEPGDRWRDPVTGMRFRYVPPGTFRMGSPRYEAGRDGDETPHEVRLTRGIWMAETEVTQDEWRDVMGSNPAYFGGCGGDCPVERVSWYEAVVYANLLSEEAGLAACYDLGGCRGSLGGGCAAGSSWCFGDFVCLDVRFRGPSCEGYRLATEAEWERAARAGTTTPFWTGDHLSLNRANFLENRYERLRSNYSGTVAARRFGANPWGLYEVHGNVLEWVWDFFGHYSASASTDPCGPWDGSHRVVRGGSWKDDASLCRAAARHRIDPGNRFHDVGFRLVRTAR